MYFLLFKDVGNAISYDGEEVALYWVTARQVAMTIPGGVLIAGQVRQLGNKEEVVELFPPVAGPKETELERLITELRECADTVRRSGGFVSNEPLNFFTPFTTRGQLPWGTKAIFIYAFRESEAAAEAYTLVRATPAGGQAAWPALARLHERDAAYLNSTV